MKRLIFFLLTLAPFLYACDFNSPQNESRPNIILIMADDLGWGDVAYNGNKIVQTPNLDAMAKTGLRFDRFYAAAPVCSPTRASCLSGRHPYRLGIPWAGDGYISNEEITIAEALKTRDYVTGHFGKWHVGGLSKTIKQSYFPGPPTTYAPPWENGFDKCFSTESMMPTYNPYYQVGGNFGTDDYRFIQDTAIAIGQQNGGFRWRDHYWTGPGQIVDEWLEGDDSALIMDQSLSFIKKQAATHQPFFAMIWFHTPHTPVVASDQDRAQYKHLKDPQAEHWYGAISAMDEQVGRLRQTLEHLKIKDNTLLWFCSDNGPSYIHNYNSTGPLRGKKAELLEGGIRVPALLEWPAIFPEARIINTSIVTSDFYPTLLKLLDIVMPGQPHLDGENVLPILANETVERKQPIGFRSPLPARLKKQETIAEEQFAWIGNRFKLISMDNGISYQLYDLINDTGEQRDVSDEFPEIKKEMLKQLRDWSDTL